MQRLNRSADASVDNSAVHHTRLTSPVRAARTVIPGLLVSVRDLTEGLLAASENVQIIDLKDPQRGALGWANPTLWHQFSEQFPTFALSVALGELADAFTIADQVPPGICFAKAGPIGATSRQQLLKSWQQLRRLLSPSVDLVAVAYADHHNAGTLPGEIIFELAKEMGVKTWLLDTFQKDGRSSFDHWGHARIGKLIEMANHAEAQFALAGSITLPTAQQFMRDQPAPHWFAVRGDVCNQGRSGQMEQAKVRRWQDWLKTVHH